MRRLLLLAAFAAALATAACSGSQTPDHYLKVIGGTFVFNYRLATAYAGALVVAERDPPVGSTVEVSFPDPAGGPPLVFQKTVAAGQYRFDFTIEPLHGVKANVDYVATIRLISPEGAELDSIQRTYRSEVDQDATVPEKPLTIGPGYTPNPEAKP